MHRLTTTGCTVYSFQPLIDTTANSHIGFYFAATSSILLVARLVRAWREDSIPLSFLVVFAVLATGVSTIVFFESYKPEKIYANEQVVGEFVGVAPEVLVEKTGKHIYTVTRKMWVTYKVNGLMVVLPANETMSYPARAILYKN